MHDHEIRHLPEIKRRDLLLGTGLTVGAMFFNNLLAEGAVAATPITLPGFSAFQSSVKVFKDSKYYLVESNGIPDHQLMVGIKSWQQQIPTPQNYLGSNAWSIPIRPVPAKNPLSAKDHFFRGAIAIAVNGVPIFNALNNRGDDAYLAGELDDWGGHCGRADDYHYHIAPTHLSKIVGAKSPIAYALDGYPIYGLTEIDGKPVLRLDQFNGHFDSKKNYHYHATNSFPYINGGFKGEVTEKDGQVDPQSLTKAFRPAGLPLRGALITNFARTGDGNYELTYQLDSQSYLVRYQASLTSVHITFVSPDGSTRDEIYQRR